MGSVPGVRLEGTAEAGPSRMASMSGEGAWVSFWCNRGQTIQGMMSKEAVGSHISFTFTPFSECFLST